MAYYDALIAKWPEAPEGTTDEKLVWINAETVTNQIPPLMYTTGDKILNCINYVEFTALSPEQQNNMLALCSVPGQLLGGSAAVEYITAGMIADYFPPTGKTIACLIELATSQVTPWWQASVEQGGGGLNGPVLPSDLEACGLS